MKNIFLTLFMLTLTVNAFAKEETKVLRVLKCTGTVAGADKVEREVKLTVKDTKYTDEFGSEYYSSLTVNDVENPSVKLFGNLTATDMDKDLDKTRNLDGARYDIGEDERPTKLERTGLLGLASPCFVDAETVIKKCPQPRGQRNYGIIMLYGGSSVVGPDARAYEGKVNCKVSVPK